VSERAAAGSFAPGLPVPVLFQHLPRAVVCPPRCRREHGPISGLCHHEACQSCAESIANLEIGGRHAAGPELGDMARADIALVAMPSLGWATPEAVDRRVAPRLDCW
jgi:hypothetical protein